MLTPVGYLVGGFAAFSMLLGSARAGCKTINHIAYCKEVESLGYSNVEWSGEYNEVVDMNKDTCECKYAKKKFTGPLGPFSEELSFHLRGPLRLKQFAAYTLSKAKRDHLRRHAHGHMHRRHIETKVVTYATTIYTTVDPPELTPPPGDGAPAPKAHKEDTPTPPHSSKPPKESPDTPKDTPTTDGWKRVSYYSSTLKKAEGLVFLNHQGGQGSGQFDYCLGLSLSYANSDMTGGAASPEILDDTFIPSGTEFTIFSDKPCKGTDCGYFRPGIPAYHGWGGYHKAFVAEFTMPRDKVGGGLSDDLPALWLLNAQIPRASQFGIKSGHCSCWPDCGEFDVFEALTGTASEPARDMMKTHVHCAKSQCGGNMNYFERPLEKTIKIAIILTGSNMYVTKLDDKTTFDEVLPDKILSECQNTQNIFSLPT